jgi:hypothetical protein
LRGGGGSSDDNSGAKLCEEHSLNPSPRCNRDGCTRFAIGGKPVCVAHSNLQACKHPDCPRVAPVGKMLCEPHFKKVRRAFLWDETLLCPC